MLKILLLADWCIGYTEKELEAERKALREAEERELAEARRAMELKEQAKLERKQKRQAFFRKIFGIKNKD